MLEPCILHDFLLSLIHVGQLHHEAARDKILHTAPQFGFHLVRLATLRLIDPESLVVVAITSVLFRQKLHRFLHERQLDRDSLVLWL